MNHNFFNPQDIVDEYKKKRKNVKNKYLIFVQN